jgi:hypothetical protein
MVKNLKLFISLVLLVVVGLAASAQVTLDVDEKINEKLRMKNASIDSTKIPGFRIQIEFSTDRNIALSAEAKFKRLFPEYGSRTAILYQQPSWKVRIGDYYREIDAQQMLKEVRLYFPDAFIVKDYIRRPFIDLE